MTLRGHRLRYREGLCGWHTFFASSPDNPPVWSPEELAALSEKTVNYNGEKYTKYEISQMQRSLERKVRSATRKNMAEPEAGVDAARAAVEQKDIIGNGRKPLVYMPPAKRLHNTTL